MPFIARTRSHAQTFRARPGIESLEGRALMHATSLQLLTPATASAGDVVPVTVKALDESGMPTSDYTGTVHFNSSDSAAMLPPDYTFTVADNGVHTFSVRLVSAGTGIISVSDTSTPSMGANAPVAVAASLLHHFDVIMPATATAGTPVDVTIIARDSQGNTVENYLGSVRFDGTVEGMRASLEHTYTAAEKGSFTTPVLLTRAGPTRLRVTNGTFSGEGTINVQASPVARYDVTADSRVTVDQPLQIRVRAEDAQGNKVTWYNGTAHFTVTGGSVDLPPDRTFLASDSGEVTVQITPHGIGDVVVTATDTTKSSVKGTIPISVRYTDVTENYLNAIYKELLGRGIDLEGMRYWKNYLTHGGDRAQVVGGIQGSPEYAQKTVGDLYQAVLHRAPDEGGLAYFADLLMRGTSVDTLTVGLMGSPEYYERRGGGSDAGFAFSLYGDLLMREATEADATGVAEMLDRGTPQAQVVSTLLGSEGSLEVLVRNSFATYLGRQPDAGGLSFFTRGLQRGMTSEDLTRGILISDEFFARAG